MNIKLITRFLARIGSRDNYSIAYNVYWNHIKYVSASVLNFNVVN